jgi:hypothetical protein
MSTMKTSNLLRSAVAALALAAIPAAAVAQMKIIAVQARVGGTTYGVSPNSETIPVRAGDRVRVELVGTSIEGGRGVERPVNARFDVASSRGRIDIAQSGPNWVVVNLRGGDDDTAQLSYTVNGRGYDMRDALRSGRITLQLDGRGGSGGGSGPIRGDGARLSRARELNRMLYRGILNESPRGNDDRREDIDRIYRDGTMGVRAVALDLAREAERDFPSRPSQDEAIRMTGDLYRGLLGRDMSDRELWDRDRGFRGNVDTLRRSGLQRLVDVIISSEEFRSVNRLVEFDRLPNDRRGGYDRNGRYDRDSRYDRDRNGRDDRYDNRRPPAF